MPNYCHLVLRFCLAGALALPLAAQADDFRFELGAGFERFNPDSDDEFDLDPDIDSITVAGTFYLKPVPTDGVPLREAAFLNRSSFISAAAQRFDDGDGNFDVFGANFGYYIPDTIFYGEVGVLKFDDLDAGDDTLVTGRVGITPIDGLLVTTQFTEDGWDANVTARYVGKFGFGNYYAAAVSVVDSDEENVDIRLDFDYFFDHTLSVGAAVSSDLVEVRAEKFFMPSFAVGGRIFTDDDFGDGGGAFVKWRF